MSNNSGYVKLENFLNVENIIKLGHFSIYHTNKNTHILVKNTSFDEISLFSPKKDRLPYKIIEGKKICKGIKVFDSKINSLYIIDTSKWNNKNQIISYSEYYVE